MRNRKTLRRGLAALGALSAASLLLIGCATTPSDSGNEGEGEGSTTSEPSSNFPNGPIEMLVGASAGGSTDQLARAIAEPLGDALGTNVVVNNLPGGNGAVAAQQVFSKAPDGQTIMLVSGSLITITPMFVDANTAVSVDDFEMITGVGKEDYVLVAHANGTIKSIDDLASATNNVKYATAGHGTGGFLSSKLLFDSLGIDSTDVPFEGGGPAVTALLGEEVDVASVQVLEAWPQIQAGTFVPIVTFGEERSPFLADIPTATESGFDSVVTQSRFVLAAPGTPADIAEQLTAAFQTVFADSAYQSFLEQNFISPDETGPEETVANLESARQAYENRAREAGLID